MAEKRARGKSEEVETSKKPRNDPSESSEMPTDESETSYEETEIVGTPAYIEKYSKIKRESETKLAYIEERFNKEEEAIDNYTRKQAIAEQKNDEKAVERWIMLLMYRLEERKALRNDKKHLKANIAMAKRQLEKCNQVPDLASPSTIVKNSVQCKFLKESILVPQKVYHSRIALQMYDSLQKCEDKDASLLSHIPDYLRETSTTSYFGHVNVENKSFHEAAYTSVFSLWLSEQLKNENVKVYHQLPSRDNERPDIYVLQVDTNGFPKSPLLIGDLKKNDEEKQKAIDETHFYATTVSIVYNGVFPFHAMLGLAGTPNEYLLYLYRGCKPHLHPIQLCTFSTFKKLVPAISCCIDILSQGESSSESPSKSQVESPSKLQVESSFKPHCCLIDCCDGDHVELRPGRVVHCKKSGMVYKYYDSQEDEHAESNFKVMCSLAGYDALQLGVKHLSSDGRYFRTACKYIESATVYTEPQKAMLRKSLVELHEKRYVHSDIRTSNILFDGEEDKAYFIDFDLCGMVYTNYPDDYNHESIEQRHKSARAGQARRFEHDLYSLRRVLEKN